MTSAVPLALSGSLFAALLPHSVTTAFLAGFGVSACQALLGLAISGRTGARRPSPGRHDLGRHDLD